MTAEQTPTDERMLADLEAEVRPLVGSVRDALAEVLTATGRDTVGRFLALAPVIDCVRLADAWAMADAVGMDTARLKARFGAEDRFLIELVTTVYTAARPTAEPVPGLDLAELVRLVTDSAFDPVG